ncbi:MAG: HAMP domain-containing histidine kinase [Parvibaculum sp.]|nr:HAMP domain-containing histidine kinase [Parvibaculum sp.]
MSETGPDNSAENRLAGHGEAAVAGSVRRSYPIETRIAAEQVKLLFSLGEASRFTIFGIILVVGLTFYQTAPLWTIGIVAAIQLVAQLAFDRVRAAFRADPDAVANAPKWANRYALVTIISGSTWGVGSILWLPGSSPAHEIFYLLVLATLIMATAIARANHPPTVFCYSIASSLPIIAVLLMRGDLLGFATVALAAMFFATVVGWTRRINESYRQAFRLRFENADLVERMARAHAATEQRRRDAAEAEARAKGAMQAKQEFLDIIGHEVRAPLEGLRNMAMYLADEAVNETQLKIATSIGETSDLLRRLMGDMIDFSEMTAHSLELKPRIFDPAALASDIVRMTRHKAVARGLSLEIDIAPDIETHMHADPERVKQVLANLIGNAIKFTYQGGIVVRVTSLQTPESETVIRFSVTDTGPGLPDDMREKAFDTFSQGADARDVRFAGQAGGMGLGLPISERLVALMGGHIGVDTAPGLGSTFWFLLPAEPGGAAAYFAALRAKDDEPKEGQPERLIDYDHLYELEQRLGPQHTSQHLIAGLEHVLDLQREIEQARLAGDSPALAEGARALKATASEIGLTAVSRIASDIDIAIGQGEPEAAMREVPGLQRKIAVTWRELAKAYPSIAA